MSLFFVNCERTVLFSVKRNLDPPFTTLLTGADKGLIPGNHYQICALYEVARHEHLYM